MSPTLNPITFHGGRARPVNYLAAPRRIEKIDSLH